MSNRIQVVVVFWANTTAAVAYLQAYSTKSFALLSVTRSGKPEKDSRGITMFHKVIMIVSFFNKGSGVMNLHCLWWIGVEKWGDG